MKVIVYSTGCPKCEILKKKLISEGVEFEECTDVDLMISKGIMSVPVLEVGGTQFSFAEALQKISEIVYKAED